VIRIATPLGIILLPLLGFYFDRVNDEPITTGLGPALYAIYALGLIAYAANASPEAFLSLAQFAGKHRAIRRFPRMSPAP